MRPRKIQPHRQVLACVICAGRYIEMRRAAHVGDGALWPRPDIEGDNLRILPHRLQGVRVTRYDWLARFNGSIITTHEALDFGSVRRRFSTEDS